jgi:hypothetical protein
VLLELARRTGRLDARRRQSELVLDLDSLPLEVFGHQPGSAWNGHYRCRCYHPVVVRWDRGPFLAAELREGQAHTAEGALGFVLPVLLWAKAYAERVWLRMDAGFPEPELLATLEDEGVAYVARLRGNAVLERLAAPRLRRPPGHPPAEGRVWLHELRYRAASWQRERRVVLVVLERSAAQGSLFLDHFFLLTNVPATEMAAEALLQHYRARGNAEKDFGEWQHSLDLSLSSTPRPKSHYRGQAVQGPAPDTDSFAANEARMLLSLLAANLMRAGADLLAAAQRQAVSRARFRQLLLRSAARVLLGSRRITVVIEAARGALWSQWWRALERSYPARGSPNCQALPTPA